MVKIRSSACMLFILFFDYVSSQVNDIPINMKKKLPIWISTMISQQVQPLYQLTMFVQENYLDDVTNQLQKDFPLAIIDTSGLQNYGEAAKWQRMPILKHVTSGLFFTIIEREDSNDGYLGRLDNILKFIDSLDPVRPRANLLLIFYSKSENSKEKLKIFLELAWKWKFLNFSILYIHDDNTGLLMYNPFIKSYLETHCNLDEITDEVTFFPDKLKNMHGYNFISYWRLLDASRFEFSHGKRVEVPGFPFYNERYFCKALNCTLVDKRFIVPSQYDEYDMHVIYFIANSEDYNNFLFSDNYEFVDVIIQGPLQPSVESDDLDSNWMEKCIISIIIISAILVFWQLAIYYEFPSLQWNPLNIYNCLMGAPMEVGPNFSQRFFYAMLLWLSYFGVSDLISILSEEKIDTLVIPEPTLEYFDSLNKTITLMNVIIDWFALTEDKRLARSLSKKTYKSSILGRLREIVVFSSFDVGVKLFTKNETDKISAVLYGMPTTNLFAPVSPYKAKFDKIRKNLYEMGIVEDQTTQCEKSISGTAFSSFRQLGKIIIDWIDQARSRFQISNDLPVNYNHLVIWLSTLLGTALIIFLYENKNRFPTILAGIFAKKKIKINRITVRPSNI